MYFCDFIKESYGILSFAEVLLGDPIEDASKKLSSFFIGDVEEKFSQIVPSLKGEIALFDDSYNISANINLVGNPINTIELKAHFRDFPYRTVGRLGFMEDFMSHSSLMEILRKPIWSEKSDGMLFKMVRKTRMSNLLCDYFSFVGLQNDGFTTIGIKVAFPDYNMKEASKESVFATYNGINRLMRFYFHNNEALKYNEETNTIYIGE